MHTNVMPGDAEAAGAIAGMVETYGRPAYEVDQWVSGECYGKAFSGRVVEVAAGWLTLEIDGGWIAVRPSDIHEPVPMDVLVADPSEVR